MATTTELAPSSGVKLGKLHLDYIDGLRGLAALFVVLHHAFEQTWPILVYPDSRPPRLVWLFLGWLRYGHYAVTFFITISGFCLMIPVIRSGSLRGGLRGFAKGRVRRILPPYYAALIISIVIAGLFLKIHTHTLYDDSLPVTLQGVIFHFLLIHNWFNATRPQISGPFWSIAVESQIYILFPVLLAVFMRRGMKAFILVSAAISLVLLLALGWALTPQYLLVFTMGMFASLKAFGAPAGSDLDLRVPGWLKWLGATALVITCASILRTHGGRLVTADILVGVMSAYLLFSVTRNPNNPVRRFASLGPIVWVGGFSYSLYLIHFPLQQLLWQDVVAPMHFSPTITFSVIAVPGTLLLTLISFLFYRLFEKPFMRAKPKA